MCGLVLLEPQLLSLGLARWRINSLHSPKIKWCLVDMMFPIDFGTVNDKWLESLDSRY
jgi:hypothetical protein